MARRTPASPAPKPTRSSKTSLAKRNSSRFPMRDMSRTLARLPACGQNRSSSSSNDIKRRTLVSASNHQYRLAARPVGLPKESDWKYTEEPVREPGEGQILIKILYISLDPAMRGWINEGKSYIAPVEIGAVMRAGGLGRVAVSKNPKFAVGDYVYGAFGGQEFAISNGQGITKINAGALPLPVFLGTLGMPGMTAYFGLLDIGQPKPGQTVVVSG